VSIAFLASSLRLIVPSLFWRDSLPRHSGHRSCLSSSIRLGCICPEVRRLRGFLLALVHSSLHVLRACYGRLSFALTGGGGASCLDLHSMYIGWRGSVGETGAGRILPATDFLYLLKMSGRLCAIVRVCIVIHGKMKSLRKARLVRSSCVYCRLIRRSCGMVSGSVLLSLDLEVGILGASS
jgi:hypothetical protein